MVKIRLLDDSDLSEVQEVFLSLERHGDGFALAITDGDGIKVTAPFILFLEPNATGKLALNLATSPNSDFVLQDELTNSIVVDPSH